MKLSNLFLAATLSVAAVLTPVKKADAGILVLNPTIIILSAAGLVGWTIPILNRDNHGGTYDRIFTPVFMTIGMIMFLDQDLDKLEETLVKAHPSLPTYILAEASQILLEKANNMAFDDKGVKNISLTEEEFSSLEDAMMDEVSPKEIQALKVTLTKSEV